MSEFIERREHEEFAQRMEDEHARQNRRINELEQSTKQINNLIVSVEKLAVNMQSMLNEQKKQGERLQELESRDGEMWRKVTGYVVTVVVGVIIGYVFNQIGM